jgi:REP element-mobilizing transposase RayT
LRPGRLISPHGTYFITFSTWQRRRLFAVENFVRLFLKTLYRYRREGRFQLHAFVVMPEHVHLLITPAANVTLEHAIQLIKGGYSHALGEILGRKREIWQRGFTDHRIRDQHRLFLPPGLHPSESGCTRTRDGPSGVSLRFRIPRIQARSVDLSGLSRFFKERLKSARVELVPFPVADFNVNISALSRKARQG